MAIGRTMASGNTTILTVLVEVVVLIYANSFYFEPESGPEQIIQLVARWVGQRAKSYVDAARLAEGIGELRLNDGSTLSSRTTLDEANRDRYPYLFCARLAHGDSNVPGRRWITEVGFRKNTADGQVECSILLKTDEMSARVTAPIQVTRPKLVPQLIAACRPVGQTPGLTVKRLDEESATAFLSEVEREERKYPIVLISTDADGAQPVPPERLRTVLVGLADVVDVPTDVDTYKVEDVVGRRYIAFGGAINIIFPARRSDRSTFFETVRLRPADIQRLQDDGKAIESEVLAAITHRTNLPYSWRHISTEIVSQAVLRGQLMRAIEQAKASDDSSVYAELLELAETELIAKTDEISRLRSDLEESATEVRTQQAEIDGLKYALNGQTAEAADNGLSAILEPLRTDYLDVLGGHPKLEQSLSLIAAFYSDRVAVLDSAFDAARESDRGGFRFGAKAFNLLAKLATGYWQALANGEGDQHAKAVFGHNAYAPNEASVLSNDAKRRRTFSYRGRDFLMVKHIKHGVKDSLAETLRVHFEWVANEKKIVIGHCGKHLAF